MKKTGPSVKRGISKQNYGTPPEFVAAVERCFGVITWDLAAEPHNAKCERFISPEHDSFTVPWHKLDPQGLLWLNPPFGEIPRWVKKCRAEMELGARIAMLVPASVSTNYYAEQIHRRVLVRPIRPRLTFVGEPQPYPKDLMLCLFGDPPDFEPWRWK